MSMTARERAAAMSAARERALFERLARRYYAGVYSYLRWLSREDALAEDLTQETFMQIWQHPPEVRGEGALRAWVYRIARNQYLQHRRRAGLETVALDDAEDAAPDLSTPGPELRLEHEELCRAVRGAVEKLPDLYREVIVLHNLEGFSLHQVAAVLDLPTGTVKSRRAKAFVMLRELLRQEEVR
jgi:RNA polymerase sigma-70 factor (ECF subfamily)